MFDSHSLIKWQNVFTVNKLTYRDPYIKIVPYLKYYTFRCLRQYNKSLKMNQQRPFYCVGRERQELRCIKNWTDKIALIPRSRLRKDIFVLSSKDMGVAKTDNGSELSTFSPGNVARYSFCNIPTLITLIIYDFI